MVYFFKEQPDRVRFEFMPAQDGAPCQLTVYHAQGSFVESFRTTAMGIKRMYELEEILVRLDENQSAA